MRLKVSPLTFKQSLIGVFVGCITCVCALVLYFQHENPAFMFLAGCQFYFMANCMDEFFFQQRIVAASKEVTYEDCK